MNRNIISAIVAGVLTASSVAAIPSFAADKNYGDTKTIAAHPAWVDNAVIYEINLRQGSPDRSLKGMQLELPRLRDLGVDILWLMPIHPISELNKKGELGSYYAVADYKGVNPEFGSMQDLKEFVRTAHALGMKVIIDEVCNHSGCDNPWVKDKPHYYAKDAKGNLISPFDWTDTFKFDYTNPEMRESMLDALEYWLREADIDGYRFDVAMEVPTDFWQDVRNRLNKVKPVFMLAEASKPELTLEAFDADYNWPMKDVFNAIAATQGVNQYAKNKKQTLPTSNAKTIRDLLSRQRQQYPKGAINMNMVTNHDLNSWEGTEFDRFGPALGAFAVLSYTLPGMPMMYTGQEVGWNHAFEFFRRDTVPDYTANEFTAFYQMLNGLKHKNRALDAGRVDGYEDLSTGSDDVLAFRRSNGKDEVIVIANLSNAEKPLNTNLNTTQTSGLRNWFTGEKIKMLPEKLTPWQYLVLVRE